MLAAVKHYLQRQQIASVADVAEHLDADPDAVRGMLDYWVQRGTAGEVPGVCGGCTQCDSATIQMYRWLG